MAGFWDISHIMKTSHTGGLTAMSFQQKWLQVLNATLHRVVVTVHNTSTERSVRNLGRSILCTIFFFFLILQTFVKLCFLSGILYLLMKAKLTKKWSATTTKSTDVVQCSSGNNMQIWVKCATLNLSSNVIYCSVLYWPDNSVSKCYFTDWWCSMQT